MNKERIYKQKNRTPRGCREIDSYIKLQDHEKRKTRAYTEDISKNYNMTCKICEDQHYYICHDGREPHHIRTEEKQQDGYKQTFEVYGCSDCSGCEHKARCLYKYDESSSMKNPANIFPHLPST